MFLFALRADETKRMYTRKLKAFFDFLELQGDLQGQARAFVTRAIKDTNWALGSLMRSIIYQKERVARKENPRKMKHRGSFFHAVMTTDVQF
jgi:hypothetical protein